MEMFEQGESNFTHNLLTRNMDTQKNDIFHGDKNKQIDKY